MDKMREEPAQTGKVCGKNPEAEEAKEPGNGREEDGSRISSGQGQAEEGESLLWDILKVFSGKEVLPKRKDIRTYSPLTLAYIGDAVYDLIIRTVVVERANRPANELHKITIKYVSAPAQARMVQALMDSLTEEEQAVYRRGKNSKPHTMAKNASPADYMKATGFEAVLGYLYLSDNMGRVLELVRKGIELSRMEL